MSICPRPVDLKPRRDFCQKIIIPFPKPNFYDLTYLGSQTLYKKHAGIALCQLIVSKKYVAVYLNVILWGTIERPHIIVFLATA